MPYPYGTLKEVERLKSIADEASDSYTKLKYYKLALSCAEAMQDGPAKEGMIALIEDYINDLE